MGWFHPRSFPEPSSTQLFSWGVVFWAVCKAQIRSLVNFFSSGLFFGLPIFRVSVLSNLKARFHILSSFRGLFLGLSLFSDSVDFSYSEDSFFLFISGIFHVSSIVLFFFLVPFLLNDWRDDFTHNGKQVVNRLKFPQGLSTLMFRLWSEVPSRGGVRGDLRKKNDLLYKDMTFWLSP